MIRAGKLDKQITIERETETVAASGAVSKTWASVATVRAELVQLSAEEYLTGFGEGDAGDAVFRIRYLSGITTADRVSFEGAKYVIEKVSFLGRHKGLQLLVRTQ